MNTFWYSVFLHPILDSPLPGPDVPDPDAADGDDHQERDHEDGDKDGYDHMGRVGYNKYAIIKITPYHPYTFHKDCDSEPGASTAPHNTQLDTSEYTSVLTTNI